jgi:hypothetical protein
MSSVTDEKRLTEGKANLKEFSGNWENALGTWSLQASYAIIAANWASHFQKASDILKNSSAKISIAIAIIFIILNILIAGVMIFLHRRRWKFAEEFPEKWKDEADLAKNSTFHKWPFTKSIEFFGFSLMVSRIVCPFVSGSFFIGSLFN